ncbi:MAG: AAA family ATPase, partial [Methanobacterium paludis]|nr:AAA family ATPase [Methanobacterium paludis]
IEDIKEAKEETDSQTNKSQSKLKKPRNPQKTQRDTEENTQKDTKDTKNDAKTSTQDMDVDEDLMERVMLEVGKNPRISLWSAKSAAVLRYLKNTKPAFSISKEASALIEAAVKDKYPDLWELFEKEGL